MANDKVNTPETDKKIQMLKEYMESDLVRSKLGLMAKQIIYKRTKSGKGVNSIDSKFSETELKPLDRLTSEKYVNSKKKFPAYGEFANQNDKCNLTYSGQLLDALQYATTKDGVVVFIDDSDRSAVYGKHQDIDNKRLSEIVQWDNKKGIKRYFMSLAAGEFNILQKFFSNEARDASKKIINGGI